MISAIKLALEARVAVKNQKNRKVKQISYVEIWIGDSLIAERIFAGPVSERYAINDFKANHRADTWSKHTREAYDFFLSFNGRI